MDALATYEPSGANDAESITERVTARLSHANPAVVLTAIKVILTPGGRSHDKTGPGRRGEERKNIAGMTLVVKDRSTMEIAKESHDRLMSTFASCKRGWSSHVISF